MLKVFISYASEDRALVDPYYVLLENEGFDPWMDHRKLVYGSNWSHEIDRAFRAANVVLLFLSPRSVNKRGFVQREANDAFEALRQKLPGDIYVIPLLLEKCEIPSRISERLQYADLNSPNVWAGVRKALKLAAEQQQVELREGVLHGPIRVYAEAIHEEFKENNPLHEIDLSVPRLVSSSHAEQCKELNSFFAGLVVDQLSSFRYEAYRNAKELEWTAGWGSDYDSSFTVNFANENVLSLIFSEHMYFAGAAHGNYAYRAYNFILRPKLMRLDITSFFSDITNGLKKFAELCEAAIIEKYKDRDGSVDENLLGWIKGGTRPKQENFKHFTFDESMFTVFFEPYQVGPYASGLITVEIPYRDLSDVLISDGPHALAAMVWLKPPT